MDKLIKAGEFLVERLKEPSTHAALATVCLTLGTQLNVGAFDSFLNIGGILFGTLGFFVSEKK